MESSVGGVCLASLPLLPELPWPRFTVPLAYQISLYAFSLPPLPSVMKLASRRIKLFVTGASFDGNLFVQGRER